MKQLAALAILVASIGTAQAANTCPEAYYEGFKAETCVLNKGHVSFEINEMNNDVRLVNIGTNASHVELTISGQEPGNGLRQDRMLAPGQTIHINIGPALNGGNVNIAYSTDAPAELALVNSEGTLEAHAG